MAVACIPARDLGRGFVGSDGAGYDSGIRVCG